jgi:hypothetical protein
MKPQVPARGILKQGEYGDSIWYYVPCDCSNPDHAHTIDIDADDCSVTVTIFTKATTKWWSLSRWKQIWKILTKGYAEMEAIAVLNEQQALNYAEALKFASRDVARLRKEMMEKHANATKNN